jgi:hypothetical protein
METTTAAHAYESRFNQRNRGNGATISVPGARVNLGTGMAGAGLKTVKGHRRGGGALNSAPMNAVRYLALGVGLFVVKFGIDFGVARAFGRTWSIYNYLLPTDISAFRLFQTPDSPDALFFLVLLAVAVPFVAVGTWATYGRLADAGAPRGWVLLFFVPVLNLFLFLILSMLPTRRPVLPAEPVVGRRPVLPIEPVMKADAETAGPQPPDAPRPVLELGRAPSAYAQRLPEGNGWSALMAALITAPLAPVVTFFGVAVLKDYGWGLFVGMPFVVGFFAATVNGLRAPRPVGSSIAAALLATVFGMTATFLFALEGFICLLFLLPLAVPVALTGGLVGHCVQANLMSRPLWWRSTALLALLPLVMGAESRFSRPATVFAVSTVVEIDAPPQRVWPHVIAFGEIAPPDDWFFHAGAAYPIRARIDGTGVGAVRYCEFSTGPFVEPITVWDAPRRLAFAVTHNPPPLREWSPYDIHPPHLENFLRSHRGQFELIALPGGRTRLVGTTWYEHGMGPEAYWRLWTDWVIHKIHRRVLEHVRAEVMAAVASGPK